MLANLSIKKQLIKEVNDYLNKYKDDLFWGGELEFIHNRLHALESSIAVVGQFSVGKSALLNALLGEEILTTRKVESTKVLTRIRNCATKNEAKVILNKIDGTQKQLPLTNVKDLQKYTTFQGEDITDALQYVDVYWPVHFLNKELILIDTPGANSITASAFKTTREQLKTSSAIIYLFMGTKGLDAEDYSLIQEYVTSKKKVFLVGTHIDQLTDSQWQEVVQDVQAKITNTDGLKAVEIVGVSSLEALQGKQSGNRQLLAQSNIEQLEHLLHEYMETKEYERAELRSIENDFLNLINEVDQHEEKEAEDVKTKEAERQLRFDRLVALTELEYVDVEEYGLLLLKKRESAIQFLNDQYEEKLLEKGNEILKSVKVKYATFQKSLKERMVASVKVDALQNTYIKHLSEVEQLYTNWNRYMQNFGEKFVKDIEVSIQSEDEKFLGMLKLLETNVAIQWNEFEAVLKNIKLKPLRIQEDFKDFDLYDQKMSTNAKYEQQLRDQIRNFESQEQSIIRKKSSEESEIGSSQRREESSLGSKPQPRAMYRTKGMLFWKSEEFVGYDYSEQEQWNEKYKAIHERYKTKKRSIEQAYKRELDKVTIHKQQTQQRIYELDEVEQEYSQELLGALYATISNQTEIVKKLHSERMATIKEEWQLITLMQEERYYEHMQTIEEQFKKFVKKSKDNAVRQIQVL